MLKHLVIAVLTLAAVSKDGRAPLIVRNSSKITGPSQPKIEVDFGGKRTPKKPEAPMSPEGI